MDKPVSLSVKNYLIRKMSTDMVIPEKIIEAVVNHQFEGALEAMRTNKSVEISGFGKFIFKEKTAGYSMRKWKTQEMIYENLLNDERLTAQVRRATEGKLKVVRDNIKYLTPKMNEDND